MDGPGQNGAGNSRMKSHHLLHDRRGQRDFIPGHGAVHLCHQRVELLLHGIGLVNRARSRDCRYRLEGSLSTMLLPQEPSRLLNPVAVEHGVSSHVDSMYAIRQSETHLRLQSTIICPTRDLSWLDS